MTTFVITVKGLKPANSCVRDQDATTAPARQMLKLSIIHASMIYQIPWIRWIQWKFCPLSKNSEWIFVFGLKEFRWHRRCLAKIYQKLLITKALYTGYWQHHMIHSLARQICAYSGLHTQTCNTKGRIIPLYLRLQGANCVHFSSIKAL